MNAILINVKDNRIVNVKMLPHPESPASAVPNYWWIDNEGNVISKVGDPDGEWQELSVDFRDREGLGKYLKQLRLLTKWSVRGLATECNLSPATIVNIEAGKYSPRLEIVMDLLRLLTGSRLCITSRKYLHLD